MNEVTKFGNYKPESWKVDTQQPENHESLNELRMHLQELLKQLEDRFDNLDLNNDSMDDRFSSWDKEQKQEFNDLTYKARDIIRVALQTHNTILKDGEEQGSYRKSLIELDSLLERWRMRIVTHALEQNEN